MMTPNIRDFPLKQFFNEKASQSAKFGLSPSYCDPMPMAELLAFEPDTLARFTQLSTAYTKMNGGEELRQQITSVYRSIAPHQIITTSGSDDAIVALFSALVNPGDKVVVHVPTYESLSSIAEWRGATLLYWNACEAEAWQPSLDELAQLLKQRPRLVVVNFPHNPTGFMPTAQYAQKLIDMADEAGAILVADEVYRGLAVTTLAANLLPSFADLSPSVIAFNTMSKAWGLPGLRVGWIASKNEAAMRLIGHMRLHFNGYLGTPNEFLTSLALRHTDAIFARNATIARTQLAQLHDFMTKHRKMLAWHAPADGVVAFPRWLGDIDTDVLSREVLAQTGVLIAPSSKFAWGHHHLRIGYGVHTFSQALALFDHYLTNLYHS